MRSVCQSVLARRLQQIHYRPRLRGSLRNLVREGGKGKVRGEGRGRGGTDGERGPRQKKGTMLPQFVRATKEPRELVWISEHVLSSHRRMDFTSPPSHHHHHHLLIIITPPHTHPTPPRLPLPPHPTPPPTERGGEKKNLLLRAQLCMHFFYLVLVDVMGKLSLSLSPSLPPASSPRRSAVCLGYARAFHRAARSTPNAGLPSVSGNFKVMPPPQPNITAGIFEGSVRHSTGHAGPKWKALGNVLGTLSDRLQWFGSPLGSKCNFCAWFNRLH